MPGQSPYSSTKVKIVRVGQRSIVSQEGRALISLCPGWWLLKLRLDPYVPRIWTYSSLSLFMNYLVLLNQIGTHSSLTKARPTYLKTFRTKLLADLSLYLAEHPLVHLWHPSSSSHNTYSFKITDASFVSNN